MGMFDSLIINCPKCGEPIEFQSKAGECLLRMHSMSDVPSKVLADLDGESETCAKCGKTVTVRARTVGFIE